MIHSSLPTIRRAIHRATGRSENTTPEPVGGGCIHEDHSQAQSVIRSLA